MKLNEFQREAKKTAIYPYDRGLEYVTYGLVSEVGEIAGKLKKSIRDGGECRDAVLAELGDVLWYVASMATELGTDLETVAAVVLTKLKDRKARGVLQGSGDHR